MKDDIGHFRRGEAGNINRSRHVFRLWNTNSTRKRGKLNCLYRLRLHTTRWDDCHTLAQPKSRCVALALESSTHIYVETGKMFV